MFNIKFIKWGLAPFSIVLWALIIVKHLFILIWKNGAIVLIIVNGVIVVWCLKEVLSISDHVSRWSRRKPDYDPKSYMDEQLQEHMVLDKGRGCPMPILDPFSPEVVKYDVAHPKVTCDRVDWVKCYLSECKVTQAIQHSHTHILCTYRDLLYITDDEYMYGPRVVKAAGKVHYLRRSDFAAVTCSGVRTTNQSKVDTNRETWSGIVAGFRSKKQKTSPKGRENAINVLMFAFDSTPRTGFIRRMPKSYKFLTEVLNATVLNRYNIVGDATFSALLPILTGRNQYELPDASRNSNRVWHNITCDQFPLLFYTLEDDGYHTAYLEGDPQIGTFQLRFVGFRRQPADHYSRPFLLAVDRLHWPTTKQAHCVGDKPQYKFLMDLTNQFMHLKGKKFILTFVSDITHDDFNMIATADDDFVDFLDRFARGGFARDTMLLVMGDHGPRFYQKYRETHQGRLEERLPLMAIVLPQKLQVERPAALATLRKNVDTLTTPHDIHSTLLDAVGLREYWNRYKAPGADIPRGMSLLEPIPNNRSCSEAGITPHWCACLDWRDVPRSEQVYAKASLALLRFINDLTEPFRIYCLHRTLVAVRWVMKIPNTGSQKETYQVKITVAPGKGDFEATMTYFKDSDTFHLDSREISRTSVLDITAYIENKLEEQLKLDKGSGCEMPVLDPFAREVTQFDKEMPKVKCEGQDWVKCYLSECKVVKEILDTYSDITCTYRDIIYESDDKYTIGAAVEVQGAGVYRLSTSDHVKISCTGTRKNTFFNLIPARWTGHAAGLRSNVARYPAPQGPENTINILIFGFDSTARNGFIRRMPKSYKYLTENMQATILKGYNVLGDGTPAALFPILTGKTELELPDARKKMRNNKSCDGMPFIFYKLRDDGYRTAYFEDMPWVGTFQYRFTGFKRQPADHYLRAFFLEESAYSSLWWGKSSKKYCIGDTPQYKIMMDLTSQFMHLDGKKFAFTFVADITHDDFNMIGTADEDFVNFLQQFQKDGFTEDTMLLVMGDHGPRYADVRNTLQGKLEERLPLMAIVLPKRLCVARPAALRALLRNADALSTPHDVHATLLDALQLTQYSNPYKVKGADLPRGMTLFETIPRNRSCSEAGIEPHWCACLAWRNVSHSDPIYRKAVQAFVDFINSMTDAHRSKCAIRTLSYVSWVMKQLANSRMLAFIEAKDSDGYVGRFGEQIRLNKETYQVKVTVDPGSGDFEASLTYLVDKDQFLVDSRDVSRTNMYGREPDCISKTHPHLNPYCYCV